MFTGIIKALGSVSAIDRRGGDARLTVRSTGLPWSDYEPGESISVNGVCLTAVALHDDGFLGEPQDRVVRHLAVLGQVLRGGREEDLHTGDLVTAG